MRALLDLVGRHKAGAAVGITSVCSAHPWVIEATLRQAAHGEGIALIEATSNQVNQDGGYTGMRPAAFRDAVHATAAAVGLPLQRVALGGDHLGPNAWQRLDAKAAMAKASVMVREYVTAGFRKIHLDCSMACGGDPPVLGEELIAERTASLCAETEAAWRQSGGEAPAYIIGSEVPVPGGAQATLTEIAVTSPSAAHATIEAHAQAFLRRGLEAAWKRVIGLVVQPGVEFDHHQVIDYQRDKAAALSRSIGAVRGMVFEAHSTDYQASSALKALVEDHFAILKVGPGATFALRQALWALADIASELELMREGSLKDVALAAMRREPKYWKAYYLDTSRERFDLQFSLSDRIRYYWTAPDVARACAQLLEVLTAKGVPLTLLSQYLPGQYAAVRDGRLRNEPREFVLDSVAQVLRQYTEACQPAAVQRAVDG